MKPQLAVFLQNAWSPVYAGTKWPRNSWLRAMWSSRSGNKIAKLVRGIDEFWIDNTTDEVGPTPDSVCAPDLNHIIITLLMFEPTVVVACGIQAGKALRDCWSGPLLCIPHPASRVVTNALYERANRMLKAGFSSRSALIQLHGEHRRVSL